MMDSATFKHDFLLFVIENFSDFEALWRDEFRAAFLGLTLSQDQIDYLLDPGNTTQQFRSEFKVALANERNLAHVPITLSAAFSEPVSKLATYFISAEKLQNEDASIDTIRKAAFALPTLEPNLGRLLGASMPDTSKSVYRKISEFGDAANEIVRHSETTSIDNINALEGMHAIALLPDTFGTPQASMV